MTAPKQAQNGAQTSTETADQHTDVRSIPARDQGLRGELAEVVAAHPEAREHSCRCGWYDTATPLATTHAQHVAELQLPVVEQAEKRAAADELISMADSVRSTEVLYRRDNGSGVKYGDPLRRTASRYRPPRRTGSPLTAAFLLPFALLRVTTFPFLEMRTLLRAALELAAD